MDPRDRFLAACQCQPVDRPPIWVMRQAGRYLPEYRELRTEHSFHEVVQTPELAAEVTMQPLRRYALDAAIMFSDILVIPEALGQPYHFREEGGIEMEFAVASADDVDRLDPSGIGDKLGYVAGAIEAISAQMADELDEPRALIGFTGSPWTLATYMVEGGSSKEYRLCRELYYNDRALFDRLLSKITEAVIAYFEMQIEAGVDAVQIFDSWGGVLSPEAFAHGSVKWMREIVEAIDGRVPVIVFSKGMHEHAELLASTGANALGVDWTARLSKVRDRLPSDVGVQGNLDPIVLNTNPDIVRREALRILDDMQGRDGFIFNLGHGITPHADPANMAALVDTVTHYAND